MKYIVTALVIAALTIPASLQAKDTKKTTVIVEKIPSTTEEFLAFRDSKATSPEGGAVVMLVALMKFMEDQNLGKQFMVIALDRSNLKDGKVYKGFAPGTGLEYHINRFSLPQRKHIPWAYVEGATPQNNYEVPLPYKFIVTQNPHSIISEDTIKVFVACYGTDWPRPVTLKKNNKGIWKAYELSSLFLDVQGPDRDTQVDDDI